MSSSLLADLPPRFLSGTAVSTFGRVLGTAISVLTIGVVTRSLSQTAGVAAYGHYAAVFAFLSVVAILADGGLSLVFTRHAASLNAAGEALFLRRVFSLRLLFFLFAAGIVVAVVALSPYTLVVRQGILVGVLGIGSQLTSQLTMGVFQKRLRMAIPAAAEVVGRLVTLLAALAVAFWVGGVLAYVGAFVVGSLATVVLNLLGARRVLHAPEVIARREPRATDEAISWGLLRRLPAGSEARHDWKAIGAILREAWPLGLMLICWMVVFRADSLLLSVLRPPEDLGYYALPYKVLESLLFFPAMIGGLLFPVFARTSAAPPLQGAATPEFHRALDASIRLFLVLSIPTILILVLAAPWVIGVLGGPAFTPSIPVLRILSLALGALFFGNLFGNSAIALGARWPLLGVAGMLAVGNVVANLLVIPRFSFLGAAWTTLGTEILSAALAARIVLTRVTGFSLTVSACHIASAGGVFLFIALLPLPVFLRIAGGLGAYVGTLWALGVLLPPDVRALFQGAGRGG